MTWPIAIVVVGALWAGAATYVARLWSRLKIAEVATALTRIRLERDAADATRHIPEVEL